MPPNYQDVADIVDTLPKIDNEEKEKSAYSSNEKIETTVEHATTLDPEDTLYDVNGKEKVLETAEDFATALVSLDDDPELPIHTFRMWFTGIGLAVFGAVLGMLFVNQNFLILRRKFIPILSTAIPAPSSRCIRPLLTIACLHVGSHPPSCHSGSGKPFPHW